MSIVQSITEVWSAIMTWITTSIESVQTVFYAEGALTFLGVLAVISVAIGIVFLVLYSYRYIAKQYSNVLNSFLFPVELLGSPKALMP